MNKAPNVNLNIVIIAGTILGGLFLWNIIKKQNVAEDYVSASSGQNISEASQGTIRTDIRQAEKTERTALRQEEQTSRVNTRQEEQTERTIYRQDSRTERQYNRQQARQELKELRQEERTARQYNRQETIRNIFDNLLN